MAQARYSPLTGSGLFAGPFNTMGIGNPMPPQVDMKQTSGIGNTSSDFVDQTPGSGDI
jgi:hypothetical protein